MQFKFQCLQSFIGAEPRSVIYILPIASFKSQWQIWEVPAETPADPQSLNYVLMWLFTGICWPLVTRLGNSLLSEVIPTISLLLNFSFKVLTWFCSWRWGPSFAAFPELTPPSNAPFYGMFHAIHLLRNTNLGNAIRSTGPQSGDANLTKRN